MLSKVKRLYRTIEEFSSIVTSRIDLQIIDRTLSPIDRYILLNGIEKKQAGLFHRSYETWRVKRLNKILEVFGIDYFKDKTILELGSGHGDIGAFCAELGAKVLCLDGRIQNVNFTRLKHRNVRNLRCEHFNLENDFSQFGRFALIINFGLLYHLKNVDAHLKCCFEVADDILLETVVCDSTDPYKIFFCNEDRNVDEEAVEGIGSRPSPFYVERIAREHNFEAIRYLDADLNCGDQFVYNWRHRDDNSFGDDFKLRRFWRMKAGNDRKSGLEIASLDVEPLRTLTR